jgi:S1-C subfamily serine protease
VSAFDIVFLLMLIGSAFGGYRRGAILQAFGLAGLLVGLMVAAVVAPAAARMAEDTASRLAIAVAVVLTGAAIGNLMGWLAGSRVRKRVDGENAKRADAVIGSALSVLALFATTWFLALNLAAGPFPSVARSIRDSQVVKLLDATLPAPPPLIAGLGRAADILGIPEAFAGLPPPPAAPVDAPAEADVLAAAEAARPSMVQILGDGCVKGFLNEGSGFVVSPHYVVTNAHVVAGTHDQSVVSGRVRLPATVIGIDPDLDVAVLYVPQLQAPALPLATAESARGTGGAILGYPGGQPLRSTPAAVRAVVDATGRDIYGQGEVERRLYELQASVRSGNSGGPFVLPDGQVAAVVFAASTLDTNTAYAIASWQVKEYVASVGGLPQPVGTGACTG